MPAENIVSAIICNDFQLKILWKRENALPLSFIRFRFLGLVNYVWVKELNLIYLNDVSQRQPMAINFMTLTDLSNQNSTPLKLDPDHLGLMTENYCGSVLAIDMKQSESPWIFKTRIKKRCHCEAAETFEKKIDW